MRDQANYINFFHTACHRPAAALGLADPGLVQPAGRGSRTKCGIENPGRSAGSKIPDEERKASNRGCLGLGGRSPLSPEIVKLF